MLSSLVGISHNARMWKLLVVLLLGLGALAFGQDYGAWRVVSEFDRITDENQSQMDVAPSERPPDSRGSFNIRCKQAASSLYGVEMYITTNRDLTSDTFHSVIYRVDRNQPIERMWRIGNDGTAAAIQVRDQLDLLGEMAGGSELVIRTVGGSETLTFVFQIHGFRNAVYALGCYTGPEL